MSSEFLASGENVLDSNLGGAWDISRFGGAAAAYSLRDIGAMNGKVVRVRRSPEDTTDAIDDEEIFSANQVQSGALEDWVNGKLESTLPADVATAAAAYSLRKVKASYSGDAVRIRRSSDDIEVDVAFDSDNKVSSSSSITNTTEQGGESGSTTATTLGDFLGETSITTGVAEMAQGSSSTLSNATTTGFTLTQDGNLIGVMFPFSSNVGIGTKVSMTFTLSEDSGNASSSFRLFGTTGLVNAGSPSTIEKADSGTYTIEFEATAEARGIGFFDNVSGSVVTISNASITIENAAFVHTWYDQAGSNDAVQATAANQPKIAENGALLADGLLFDGSNDSFEATDITDVNFPATVVSVSETNKIGSPNTALYSLNNDSDACCGFYRSTSKYAINNGTTTLEGSATYTTGVHRLKFDLFNGASSAGFSNAVSDISGDIGTQVSQVTHFRIAGSLKAGITNPHNGTIKEIILYTSDQSDNRFKIESNINNYYGLYNDANDLTQSTWQNTGTESFSSTSTDGFSYSNSSSTAFIGVTLSETLALNDSVFISFNASGVTHPASSDQSPQVRLRDSVSGGSGTSPINQVTNGFNAYTLTYNTGSSGQHIVFSEGDTAGGTVTISDFKVSRIARNGFVETWYDQSGSGRDMEQTAAADQPHIVENGGICKDSSGTNPTVKFVNVGTNLGSTFLETTTSVIPAGETALCYLTVASTSTTSVNRQTFNGAGTDFCLGSTNNLRLRYNGSADTFSSATLNMSVDTNHLVIASVNSSKVCTLHLDDSSDTNTSAFSADASTLNQFLGENSSSATTDTLGLEGTMSEIILYLGDKTNDISDFQNDINNFYNI
jgi:hypothetical protein